MDAPNSSVETTGRAKVTRNKNPLLILLVGICIPSLSTLSVLPIQSLFGDSGAPAQFIVLLFGAMAGVPINAVAVNRGIKRGRAWETISVIVVALNGMWLLVACLLSLMFFAIQRLRS